MLSKLPQLRSLTRTFQTSGHVLASSTVHRAAFHASSRSLAVVHFKLADIGEGIAEVELMKWFVQKGDTVKSFDKICEVQSDKATVEITSKYSGVITSINHLEGDIVKVGDSLVDIDTPDAGAVASASSAPAAAPVAAPVTAPAPIPAAAAGKSGVVHFKLADIGEGIAEVELMKWFVQKGDTVKSFDKICEVQSDKATVEITSKYSGVITSINHLEGDIVKVGDSLVDIAVEGAAASVAAPVAAAPVAAACASSQQVASSSNTPGDISRANASVLTTPAVRKIAKENGIRLSDIIGTGPKNRILKSDILNFISNGGKNAPTSTPTSTAAVSTAVVAPTVTTTTTVQQQGQKSSFFAAGETVRTEKIRGIQRMMVKSMTAAREIQTFVYADEINVDRLVQLRKEIVVDAKKQGIKFSYMPLILKAASLALLDYPALNASVNKDATEITYYASHNIGIAVDTPKGLVVPVIKDIQAKSVMDIAVEINRLQIAASEGKLTEADLQGGTFSISNIGSIGGTYMMPVLVVPQVCIGALGKFQIVPKYKFLDGAPGEPTMEDIQTGAAVSTPSTIMNMSWSADHRVVDGATVARFSNQWKKYIETPTAMLSKML